MPKQKYSIYRCALCGGKLPVGRWIVGKNRQLNGGIPRYHWPGECRKERKNHA